MRNMVKALWVYLVTGEFGIPSVYKPSAVTRQLRKLFSQYGLLNRQIRMLKNNVQAILMENGIVLPAKEFVICYLGRLLPLPGCFRLASYEVHRIQVIQPTRF